MGREDAGVQLHVSGLIHAVNVSEGSGDAEVRGDGPQGLLYSPDLSPKTARTETTNVYSRLATKKKQDILRSDAALPSPPKHKALKPNK